MIRITWLLLLVSLALGCKDESINGACGPKIIITEEEGTIISDPYQVTSAFIENDCLAIEIVAGGCNGNSWEATLFMSPLLAESLPPQASLQMALKDQELCEAAISRIFYFDLQPLENIANPIILHLIGWEEPIYYSKFESENIIGEWDLLNINGGLAGFDIQFEKGQILWSFDEDRVNITNNASNEVYSGFESGEYSYKVTMVENEPFLTIDNENLGRITYLSNDSLVVDQRYVDGFQFVLAKFE